MDDKIGVNQLTDYKLLIANLIKKYSNNESMKMIGKILNYMKDNTILQFYCTIYKNTDINPFSSDINLSFEFIDNSPPYIQILNDFINPTLNDVRNIFYCLTNQHQYIFKKNKLEEFEKTFHKIIDGLKYFLLCLKENIQINVYIYYGEYQMEHIYDINDFLTNKNTIKFFRIIKINGKNEEMRYIVITQLFFLLFEPLNSDKSLAKLEQFFYLKDINFSLDEVILNKKKLKKNTFFLKILNNLTKNLFEIEFILYSENIGNNVNLENNDSTNNKYLEFKNILLSKKNEIDLKKYKIIITNYKPLFTIEIKKKDKKNNKIISNMYNDYKLYIAYFEELYNYYKDFKEANIQKRVKTYLGNLTYFCVEFISFYDSNEEEVQIYRLKMIKYLNEQE